MSTQNRPFLAHKLDGVIRIDRTRIRDRSWSGVPDRCIGKRRLWLYVGRCEQDFNRLGQVQRVGDLPDLDIELPQVLEEACESRAIGQLDLGLRSPS